MTRMELSGAIPSTWSVSRRDDHANDPRCPRHRGPRRRLRRRSEHSGASRSERGTHTGPAASASRHQWRPRPPRPARAARSAASCTTSSTEAPATTEVDAVADGASVSGTAVTAFRGGTHTVRLGCAARYGGTWVLGGTIEKSTVPGESAGAWSAVTVKDGSPQQIAVWLSAGPPKPVAPATPSWRRSRQPSSSLGPSIPWSPGCWCPRLIPSPERERGVNA